MRSQDLFEILGKSGAVDRQDQPTWSSKRKRLMKVPSKPEVLEDDWKLELGLNLSVSES